MNCATWCTKLCFIYFLITFTRSGYRHLVLTFWTKLWTYLPKDKRLYLDFENYLTTRIINCSWTITALLRIQAKNKYSYNFYVVVFRHALARRNWQIFYSIHFRPCPAPPNEFLKKLLRQLQLLLNRVK